MEENKYAIDIYIEKIKLFLGDSFLLVKPIIDNTVNSLDSTDWWLSTATDAERCELIYNATIGMNEWPEKITGTLTTTDGPIYSVTGNIESFVQFDDAFILNGMYYCGTLTIDSVIDVVDGEEDPVLMMLPGGRQLPLPY